MRPSGYTRRQLLGVLACTAGLANGQTDSPVRTSRQWYRASARVSLFGVPIINKQDVGGAAAVIEESIESGTHVSALQFNAGSWPDRLGGFNRFGYIQEVLRTPPGGPRESSFVEFMTASAEKSVAEARQTWSDRAKPTTIAATHGRCGAAGVESVVEHVELPGRHNWSELAGVLDTLRTTTAADRKWTRINGVSPSLFLHAVRQALLSNDVETHQDFFHAGKLYTLKTQKHGAMLAGAIYVRDTRESAFKVWFDPAAPAALPQAFEFKPKSFLELRFDRCQPIAGVLIPSLLDAGVRTAATGN